MAAQLEVALGGMIQGGSWPAATNKKRSSAGFWEEEVVQLMMGRRPLHHLDVSRPSSNSSTAARPAIPPPTISNNATCATPTLDLLGSTSSSHPPPGLFRPLAAEDTEGGSASCFDLDAHSPLPSGWEKCLDLQTGSIYYLNRNTGLSTSCDPRKASASSVNWPTSPSSSSDLTFEANVPTPSSTKPTPPAAERPNHIESINLDLTLSLKPCSPCLVSSSLNPSRNHDHKHDLTHEFRSLISSQGPPYHQGLTSNVSSLPFNSSRASFALPTCTSSTTSSPSASSSPSTLFFQELSAFKDMGTTISSKEGMSMNVNLSLNGMSRHRSNNNLSMNVREEPLIRGSHNNSSPIIKNLGVSLRAATPTFSDTHNMNASSSGPMITVGCANCLMFVMLPKSCSPKCPRCGASIDSDLPQPPSFKKPKLGFSFIN